MCSKCFESEYSNFIDEETNSKIDEKIKNLLAEKVLVFLSKVRSEKFIYKNYCEYKCSFCNEIWCYSFADLYWRGFLVKKENIQEITSKFRNAERKRKNRLIILIFLIITVIVIFLNSCSASTNIQGKYKSNFADLGFFSNTINLKNDGTFEYNYSGDLTNQDLTGTYRIDRNKLYLKFKKEKYDIESNNDTISITEMISGNYHNYDLKNENKIEYHRKVKIGNKKLFSYRIGNGKLVKHAKKYTNKKRYILFGPNWKMKRFYLKKIK